MDSGTCSGEFKRNAVARLPSRAYPVGEGFDRLGVSP